MNEGARPDPALVWLRGANRRRCHPAIASARPGPAEAGRVRSFIGRALLAAAQCRSPHEMTNFRPRDIAVRSGRRTSFRESRCRS